jgi:hypothetical protein
MTRSQIDRRSRHLVLALAPAAALAILGCRTSETPTMTSTITPAPTTGLAVLSSDYSTTSLSLVDPTTRAVVHDDCVDSNTVPPTLSLALSGDVALPSHAQVGGEVLLIDDGNNALTWVDPQTCKIRHQISIADFKAFAHDVISVSATKAYVTRFGTNPAPTADPMSLGDDVLIINPSSSPQPTIVGRIDMAPYAATVTGATIEARPDKGILIGDKLYVTLASQSSNYSATGVGRIVEIDTTTDQVSGMIDIPSLAGCARMEYVAATQILYVACGGSSSAANQESTSGVARIDFSGAAPSLKDTLLACWVGTQPFNFSWVAPVSDTQVWAATFGAFDFTTNAQTAPDTLWSMNPVTESGTMSIQGGAFNLGRTAFLATPPTLFVPDADAAHPLVHVLDLGGAAQVDIDANPSQHLPPREVAWY